ncbi:MAG: hypothetical protein QM488_18480 [Rhizobiaceae bacterium]
MSMITPKEDWAELRRKSTEVMPELAEKLGLTKVLLGYQGRTVRLLESACPVLFIEKSRRIGLTWALASYAVLRAGRARSAGGMDAMYISYSREMTLEFIDACAMWAKAFSEAAMEMQEFLFEDKHKDGDQSIQAFRIRFDSGFEIVALSSAPRSLRGKQGLVIIDEAAFVDNLKQLLKAAMAFLMWGGQVVVCSTHNGTENEFNIQIQKILGGTSKFKHLRIDLDDALKDGLYERICLVTGVEWTPEGEAEWRDDLLGFYGDSADEELFCIPSQGSGSWLSMPLIESRMNLPGPVLRLDLPKNYLQLSQVERATLLSPFMHDLEEALDKLDLDKQYAHGFDFGRVSDLTVSTLLSIETNMDRSEAITVELRGVPGNEQKMIVALMLNHVRHRLVGAAFDATGMGWTVAEDMGRLFGLREKEESTGLVMAIHFSQEWYRINMPPVKVAFEDCAIHLIEDREHATDLHIAKVIRGIPRVPDVRTGEGDKKRHGDFTVALALAYYASRMAWHEYSYEAPNLPGRSSSQSRDEKFNNSDYDDDFAARDPYSTPLGATIRGGF